MKRRDEDWPWQLKLVLFPCAVWWWLSWPYRLAEDFLFSRLPIKAGAFHYAGQGELTILPYIAAAWTETDEATEWKFHHLSKTAHIGMTLVPSISIGAVLLLLYCIRER